MMDKQYDDLGREYAEQTNMTPAQLADAIEHHLSYVQELAVKLKKDLNHKD